MVRFESMDPAYVAEVETPRWYDGVGLYVLIALLVVIAWAAA